ncbi:MAG TPA: preprotein translocase YidC [Clostridiales bacterium]|nr:YidC/Oxa1 family membrane protein insertase [Clostridiales bacterium]HBL82482.1 preprotein translocase YidC [Clostridiales bacterium]
MNSVFDIINVPLGYLFKWIYYVVGNYGWTIILFTLIMKLILFPLTLKQQRSMKKTQAIQPKLAKLQEKYKYDQEKLSQETMKLYQEAGVNPMGGCLPMLIQFPILIALYNIIRKPISYVMMLSNDVIMQIYERINGSAAADFARIDQIDLANKMRGSFDKVGEFISSHDLINFDFFGFNLSVTPTLQYISEHWIYVLIPIVAGGTTFLVSHISNKMSGMASQENNPTASSMKVMNYLFPLMTAWFAVTLPAGLGLYWTVSNLFQILQMYLMNKHITVDVPVDEDRPTHYRERKKKKK